MSRKIVVVSCRVCPYKDHSGGYGTPAYKPVCTKKGRQALPYDEKASRGRVVAQLRDGIPDWCPLEKN